MHGWHIVLESRHVMAWVHVVLPLHLSLRQHTHSGTAAGITLVRQAAERHRRARQPCTHGRTPCLQGRGRKAPASTHHHNNDSKHNHADSGIGNSALAAASAACAQQR